MPWTRACDGTLRVHEGGVDLPTLVPQTQAKRRLHLRGNRSPLRLHARCLHLGDASMPHENSVNDLCFSFRTGTQLLHNWGSPVQMCPAACRPSFTRTGHVLGTLMPG